MKLKKLTAILMVAAMSVGLVACGNSDNDDSKKSSNNTTKVEDGGEDATGSLKYTDVTLGETGTDIDTTIKVLTNRTDLLEDTATHPYSEYVEKFNEMYPNIKVEIEGLTDYSSESLLRLQGGDWGDVMFIPDVDAAEYEDYFMPLGTKEDVATQVNYFDKIYGGQVYGIPYTAGVNGGIVYNKKVFEAAGITETPKTPEDFLAALQKIKDNTDAIPLYTNYAAGWALSGQWDPAIGGSATGDAAYMNQKLLHTSNPFSDPGDGTGAYNVYKVLYDAVQSGLIEEDYATTDWEGCKGMINNGEIGCMVLGTWAVPQMQEAGENADDIAYMPFPITVDGKQYASVGPDYSYCINADTDETQQLASLIFVKFMTVESGMSQNVGGLPMTVGDSNTPEIYAAFDGVEYLVDEFALEGEEDLKNTLNADSELNITAGGERKVEEIIEHAANNDKSFDDIMDEWNEAWTSAQESNGVEVE